MAQGGSGGGGGSKWGGTALFMAAAAAGGCAAAYAAYRYAWQPRRIGFVRHITLAGGREVIGLDAEWEPDGSNPKVAVVQISTESDAFVLQLLHMDGVPDALKELLGDPHLVKSGLGIADDARRLREDYGLAVGPLVDVREAALGVGRGEHSLAALCAELCGVELDKRFQCSHWSRRTLSEDQVVYAALDAWASRGVLYRLFELSGGGAVAPAARGWWGPWDGERAAPVRAWGGRGEGEAWGRLRRIRELNPPIVQWSRDFEVSADALAKRSKRGSKKRGKRGGVKHGGAGGAGAGEGGATGGGAGSGGGGGGGGGGGAMRGAEVEPVAADASAAVGASAAVSVLEMRAKKAKPSKTAEEREKDLKDPRPGRMRTRKSVLYENCRIQAPDGTVLCTCGAKKIRCEKEIADIVCEDPLTIRLRFSPKNAVRANFDKGKGHADDQFYVVDKENRCCCCGREGDYLRHSVVPHSYRQHFPENMKSHISHDILLCCLKCHQRCGLYDQERMMKLGEEHGAPLDTGGPTSKIIIDPELAHLRSCARALQRHAPPKGSLPAARVAQHEGVIRAHLNMADGDPLTEEMVAKAADVEPKLSNPNYVSHAERVVGALFAQGGRERLEQFVREWREHFLSVMQPGFMPPYWAVDNRTVNSDAWDPSVRLPMQS